MIMGFALRMTGCWILVQSFCSVHGFQSVQPTLRTLHGRLRGREGLISSRCMATPTPSKSKLRLKTSLDMEFYHMPSREGQGNPPVIFLHGSFHGGWCWSDWMDLFARRGFASYAPSLRGTSGSPQREGVKSVQLSEHTEDILSFIDAVLPPDSPPPVLVGHSFGGMYAQKVLESRPTKFHSLILLCSVGPAGASGTVRRYIFSKPRLAWDIVQAFVLKKAGTDLDICRKIFFSQDNPPDEQVREYMQLFARDSVVGLDVGKAIKEFPSKTCRGEDGKADWLSVGPPVLVVGTRDDKVVDAPAVEETAEFYGCEAKFLPGAHEIMLEDTWKENAEFVVDWIEKVGAGK
mmetsp:Transcript_39638/g.124578  ORF Transcript_39638/g.124578 Transcript_39638/m.124578 type:complete len:348 (-) Transcript_39638:30-1073(-)